jgi:hypothetical protein
MSKIYRRPMFRGGGKVSSYGNGIATGLAAGGRVGYEMGGNVRGGVVKLPGGYALTANQRALLFDPAKTGSFKQPATSAQTYGTQFGGATSNPIKTGTSIVENALNNAKTNTAKIKSGIGNIKSGIGKMNFSEKGIMQGLKKLPALGDKLTGYGMKGIKRFPALSFGLGAEYVTRPQDIDKFIYEQEGYGPIEGRFRQILDPTYTSKLTDIYAQGYNEDGKLNALLKEQTEKKEDADAADTGKETTVDINTGVPVESRKDRLKRTAKEYQEILGDGIKKDSIFDAMVMGGTSLMEGQGFAQAAREVNKSLDPIQNIKTASRKLALEEDIAMRKAMATAAGKETETSRKIAAMKAGNFTPEQIANAVAGIKTKSIAEEAKDANSKTEGYRNWHIKNEPNIKVTEFTEVKDIEKAAENLPDGVYYVTFPGDTYVKIEGNKVVAKKRRGG